MHTAQPRNRLATLLAACALMGLAGCFDDDSLAVAPEPAPLDREAIGYYCSMIVADHQGPEGQIFVRDRAQPYWFSSARDALAFTMLPGEPKSIAAIYVNDMGRASWESPEPDTWIEAREAWFVIGSDRVGGMGAPETVPFAERTAAETFVATHGGTIVRFDAVPEEAVLAAVAAPHPGAVTAATDGHGDAPPPSAATTAAHGDHQ